MRSPFRRTAVRGTFLGLAWMVLALSEVSAVDRYVRETPCNSVDCPSSFPSPWSTALPSLQDALAMSTSGDTIHVAVGTYYPDDGAGITPRDRNAVFKLKPGVTLKGGYAGVPTLPDPVDPVTYPGDPIGAVTGRSTLSGDIGFPGGLTDNSLRVVLADHQITSGAQMEGFDIINDCPWGDTCRAVEIRRALKVRIANGSAQGRAADSGGAIYALSFNGEVELNALDITGTAKQGGGVYCETRKLTVQGGRIYDSQAFGSTGPGLAGGIYFSGQDALLSGVKIENNWSDDAAGGWLIAYGGRIEVSGTTVFRNQAFAFEGATGGLRLEGGTQAVKSSKFDEQFAFGDRATASLELVYADRSEVFNSHFVGSSAFGWSPVTPLVRFNEGGPALVASSTFYGGTPGADGETGIDWSSAWSGSGLTVTNTIFNSLHLPVISPPGIPHVRFSYLPDTWSGPGSANIVNSAPPFSFDLDVPLRPVQGSIVVDQGNRADVPSDIITDLAGGPRFSSRNQCPAPVDIGAYERADPSTLCRADFDGDCDDTVADIFAYLRAYFAIDPDADLDSDGDVDIIDLQGMFLPAWFAGCP